MAAYARHARLAMLGLVGFLLLYLGLTCAFTVAALRMLPRGWWAADFGLLALGTVDLLLALFLLRGLVFRRRSSIAAIEITAADQPRFFAFLEQLVARAGAPRPHRVYVSHEVNAAVVYDISVLNLVWPTRKNLVVGLGLVNVLSLGELEAVLAHEFGHFAQRTMAVGRWVYVAQRVAVQLVARRGVLDDVLEFFSDPRLALLGWPLRLIVWSLRSTIEIMLRGMIVAERALAREMEFEADQVAVALTGSDAPVHALHRCIGAETGLDEALDLAFEQLDARRVVGDLYEVHTSVLARLATILDNPHFARTPPRPSGDPAHHRVFEHERAQPPKMWATHPTNRAREDRAKTPYVARTCDERPAWVVFDEPLELRRRVTRHFFKLLEVPVDEMQTLSDAEHATLIERRYGRRYLDPSYRGAYLGRSCVREARHVTELFDPEPASFEFERLYPPSLREDLVRWKDVELERALLEGVRAGHLSTPDGVIRHRGRPITPRELPLVLAALADECSEARRRLAAHDRACRTLHAAAARWLGEDWARYHHAMVSLLHYADHSEASLRDAQRHLEHVIELVTADDRVTSDETRQVVASALDLHRQLLAIHEQVDLVVVPEPVERLLGGGWSTLLDERYHNTAPSPDNLGDWLSAASGWFIATASALDKLERACLEHLLELEELLESCVRQQRHPGPAPAPAQGPSEYAVLPPGSERKREVQLDLWHRFYLARGWGPALLRTVAALAVVGGVLLGSAWLGR